VKIAGSHVLPAPPQQVYNTLQDPDVLARAMPGCERLNRIAPGEYEMQMKVAIASVQGLFAGKVHLRDPAPPHSYRMVVEGTGKVGFVKGEGVVSLTPEGGATVVSYSGDVQVGGVIAAVGQRLLDTTSRFVIRKFFESVAQQMSGADSQAAPGVLSGD
jgi:carbon monoxide dehydrogenase subunit G